ncbi:MAG: hypothetical protein IPN02_10190 [Candidatus Microthrix sp.]|uniref:Uncharacterized protein n=1 Tax=Candidatus Neomicrothrix subdominans TaxID=2954438 RepID=A0A936NCI7_9ACTN|nr:hypothetical protein [Candidatus Microthrix subdominans]
MGSPEEFFVDAPSPSLPGFPAPAAGELYLEMHWVTHTAQAKTKAGNRRSEALLREVEWWANAAAGGRPDATYP